MSTPPEPTPVERHALSLGRTALVAYMGGEHETAFKAVQEIHDECGGEYLELVMCAWIDTFGASIGAEPGRNAVRLEFLGLHRDDCECGEPHGVTGADAVARPEVVWAGRLMAARLALDVHMCEALIAALPEDDPFAVGQHVAALLEVCALSMMRPQVTP